MHSLTALVGTDGDGNGGLSGWTGPAAAGGLAFFVPPVGADSLGALPPPAGHGGAATFPAAPDGLALKGVGG